MQERRDEECVRLGFLVAYMMVSQQMAVERVLYDREVKCLEEVAHFDLYLQEGARRTSILQGQLNLKKPHKQAKGGKGKLYLNRCRKKLKVSTVYL